MTFLARRELGISWLILGLLILVSCHESSTGSETIVATVGVESETPISLTRPAEMATAILPEGTPAIGATETTMAVQPTSSFEDAPTAQTEAEVAPLTAETVWHRLDTTGGGGQTGIAPHPTNPDIVYMASDNGGLFETENGGDSWVSRSSNLGAYRLGFVTLDPLDPEVIYVTASTQYGALKDGGATGEIHRSLNGGLSWEFVSDGPGFQNSFPNQISLVIPFDPAAPQRFDQDDDGLSDVILVGAWTGPAKPPVGGIWRSEDEGATFTQLAFKDSNVMALRAFAGDVNILFMTTYEGEVYHSDDMGENWLDISGNMPLKHPADLAVHPDDPDILYVTCRWCQRGDPPVWKTTDGGRDWVPASQGLDSDEIESFPRILMDRFDSNILYLTTHQAVAAKAGVYQSTDGGEHWELMPARLVLPDGRPYYWLKFDNNLTIGQAVDGRLFTGGGGGWRYPAGNGQKVWEPATLGVGNIQVSAIEVDPVDPAILYQGIADFGPYKSVDQGATFHRILGNGWPVTTENFLWNGPYYTNYELCRLVCSTSCNQPGSVVFGGATDFAISKQDPNIVYSAFGSGSNQSSHGGVNKSTDGGRSWQPLGFQLEAGFELNPDACVPYGFRHLALDSADDDILFAAMEIPATQESKLYKTDDGGLTWSELFSGPSYITGLEVSPLNSSRVVFSTKTDVYSSDQAGASDSWQKITPANAAQIQTISLSPHVEQVYVIGTNDEGIYYTADGGESWQNNSLKDLAEQKLGQGSLESLAPEQAAALNPKARTLKNVSAIVFDPISPDTFYIGGTRYVRASFGVVKITEAGQKWQRLPLAGLSHRNIFDLAIDSPGEFLYAGTFDGTYRLKLR